MKLLAALVATFVLLAAPSCSLLAPSFDVGVCTAGKLGPQMAAIKAEVGTCIGTADYFPCLESLAKRVGDAVVICTVRQFTGVGATPTTDPNKRERARAYLNAKGAK